MELVNSSDLTHAAAIAYYALLSLFPFLLLVISLLGAVTADDRDRLPGRDPVQDLGEVARHFGCRQLDHARGPYQRNLIKHLGFHVKRSR